MTEACAKCGGGERWLVGAVRERAAPGWSDLGGIDGVAPLSVAICCACGHTDWRSPPTARLPDRRGRRRHIMDERIYCRDCAGISHLLIAELHEEATTEGWYIVAERRLAVMPGRAGGGRFALLVCDECGLVDWFAWDLPETAGARCGDTCARCASQRIRSVRPINEEDGRPLVVAVVEERGVGEFEVRWCTHCGVCDWRAHHIEQLSPDGKSIVRVNATERTRVPVAGGPYR